MCHGVTVSLTGCQRRAAGGHCSAAACASLEPASGHPSAAQRLPVGVVIIKSYPTSMSLVLKPRSKKRFVRQSIPAKQAPRCGGDHRANVAADVFEKSRRQVVALWPWLYRSMQQSAPLVPPFLQVALISSLPPVFAITTILTVTRTPLTAHSSPAASVRPRHQNSPYCWLWRRF